MSLQIQLKKSAVSQKQPFASDLAVGELALNYNANGPFLTCKDSAGNVRKLNNVWVSNSAPNNPSAGDLWLDTSATLAVLKVYKNSTATWVDAVTIPVASTTVFGTVQLATSADITNGTAGKVVDAAQLQSKITTELSANPITFQGVSVVNNVTIGGDLTVNGTQTVLNTNVLNVEDKNIVLGNVTTPSDATADGGGISLLGASTKTFNWVDATDSWTSSENIDLASGKSIRINNTEVLSATALGSSVQISSANIPNGTIVDSDVNASAAIAGTKISPNFGSQNISTTGTYSGTWQGNTVTAAYGGTGQTTYSNGQVLIGKTDGTLAKSTLTAGSNVTITNGDGSISIASSDTTYTAGDGLDLTGTSFSADLKANGGLVIESTELAVDLGAASITGTLATGDGGTGQTTYSNGQLLVGKTDGTLAKTTLTAGSNITITNGDGSITIAATDSGVASVSASSPLASTGGTTPDISIQDGTTTQKGAVQLEDSTSSTSTTKAATPNSVKSAYDLANAALPKAGGALTGDVTLNAQSDLRFADSDSSNWVALQAPATVASNVTWTLPATDGTTNQVLQTNGTGTLGWASVAAGATLAEFTSSGTWTKPSGANFVLVEVWGAGGGGGGGRCGNTSTTRLGGTGGGGGAYNYKVFKASDLAATETVTIGTGGTGGTGVTASNSGGSGTSGGNTTFGALLTGYGGGGGLGGTSTTPLEGGGGAGTLDAGASSVAGAPAFPGFGGGYTTAGATSSTGASGFGGGAGGASAGAGTISPGGGSSDGGAGGGCGGNITSVNALVAGTAGGSQSGQNGGGGAAGANNANGTAGQAFQGGGGGGAGNTTPGNGGAGGTAAGGGGGGGGTAGVVSGAGGNGGAGYCRVYAW